MRCEGMRYCTEQNRNYTYDKCQVGTTTLATSSHDAKEEKGRKEDCDETKVMIAEITIRKCADRPFYISQAQITTA